MIIKKKIKKIKMDMIKKKTKMMNRDSMRDMVFNRNYNKIMIHCNKELFQRNICLDKITLISMIKRNHPLRMRITLMRDLKVITIMGTVI